MTNDSVDSWSAQDGVRKRPAMYVGSTDARGIHMLACELFDNAVDQFRAGTASCLTVTLHSDGSLTCEDDGDGVSCDGVPEFEGRSFLEVVLTEMFAGGRFVKGRYGTGMSWGVGMLAVNALSVWLVAESHWRGSTWTLRCEAGRVTESLVRISTTDRHGLRVTFKPDTTIFIACRLDAATIVHRLSEVAFLVPGFRIDFHDEAISEHRHFFCEAGTADHVSVLVSGEKTAIPKAVRVTRSTDGLRLDAAFTYRLARNTDAEMISYVNCFRTVDGGTHQLGFEHGLSAALKTFAAQHQLAEPAL